MAESFLEEQLKRIKRLTAEMSKIEYRAAQLSKELSRERELIRQGPLNGVRDYRTFDSQDDRRSDKDSHEDRLRKPRKPAHAPASRRRYR